MVLNVICFLFLIAVTASSKSLKPNVEDYGKHLHPPLVRTIRSLEDELKDLPLENDHFEHAFRSDTLGTSDGDSLESMESAPSSASKATKPNDENMDQFSSPAATEYMVTSTATPQLTSGHWLVNETPAPMDSDSEPSEGQKEDGSSSSDIEEAVTSLSVKANGDTAWLLMDSSTEPPAYVREAYFSAKQESPPLDGAVDEHGTEQSAGNVANWTRVSAGQKELAGDVIQSEVALDVEKVSEESVEKASLAERVTPGYDDHSAVEEDADDRGEEDTQDDGPNDEWKSVSKKGGRRRAVDEAATEDIMEMLIKVAEHPKDWEQIRQLLEKIEYEGVTLKKAKSRLRALAKQQQIKLRKEGGKSKSGLKSPVKTAENDVLPKGHGTITSHFGDVKLGKMAGGERHALNQSSKQGIDGGFVKAIPMTVSGKPSKQQSQRHRHYGHRLDDDDFAIEQPVTVIGERSRVDPVEKQLIEASANRRLRELEKEKAKLAAILKPTDKIEEELKQVSKMEHRLKEHLRQKQKLLQKIRNTAQEHSKEQQHSKW